MPTNIAWTDETWNPIHGCSRVSAGCDNCYAERLSYERHGWTDEPWTAEHAEENVTLKPERLEPGGDGHPAGYDEPKRIFVNSMSDVFHAQVPDEYIREIFAVMRNYPEHVFQILTKRPGRAAEMELQWPPNVWIGTSVEDARVIERLDLLRGCGADTLFVSFEPLIGPVADCSDEIEEKLVGFDWAIVGGESGPDYREMAHEWVWPIARACMKQDVAFFFKQSSAAKPETGQALRCPDGQRREFREMPDLNPAVERARETRLAADGGILVPVETWFDADWIDCIECRGNGQRVECMDDLCHAQGRCMHDAVNNVCSLCGGTGEITKELADRWSSRDSFEAVIAPDPDLWRRGKLHAAARERHDREVQDSDNTAGDDRPGAA